MASALDELDAAIAGLEDIAIVPSHARHDSSDDESSATMTVPMNPRLRQKSLPDLTSSMLPPPPLQSAVYSQPPTPAFLNLASATRPPMRPPLTSSLPPMFTQSQAIRTMSAPTVFDDVPPPPPPTTAHGGMSLPPLKAVASGFNLNNTYSYELSSTSNANNLLYETAPRSPAGQSSFSSPYSNNYSAQSPMNSAAHIPFTASVAQKKPGSGLPPPPSDKMPAMPKRIIEVITSDGSLSKKLEISDDMTGMVWNIFLVLFLFWLLLFNSIIFFFLLSSCPAN
jgi:hypothetical protein